MKTPSPINAVRTRVKLVAGAGPMRTDAFWAEYSHDRLSWHPIEGFTRHSLDDARAICERFAAAQAVTPPVGITVWEGEK